MIASSLNPQVVAWIESGRLTEALRGDGAYFLMDHTWRDQHDRMLIMYVLLRWAESNMRVPQASFDFNAALDALHKANEIDAMRDSLTAYRISSQDTGIVLDIDLKVWWQAISEETV